MALAATSLAVCSGNTSLAGLPATDQRGVPRVVAGRLDLGAYQVDKIVPVRLRPPGSLPSAILVGQTTKNLVDAIDVADRISGPAELILSPRTIYTFRVADNS